MEGTKVASRYAKSLLDLAVEKGELEKVYADMKFIRQTCSQSNELTVMLKSPIVKSDKKEKILAAIFGKNISEMSREFVNIIVRKRREYALEAIAASFVEQYKSKKKILTAVITTAAGLDEELRKKVLEIVKKSAQSEVELIEKVDKNIIGGFIIRVGDKQDDTSVRTKIMKLNRLFNENPFIKEF
jgi:F-type H+-transporting ATPase subunit delta